MGTSPTSIPHNPQLSNDPDVKVEDLEPKLMKNELAKKQLLLELKLEQELVMEMRKTLQESQDLAAQLRAKEQQALTER